MTQEELEIINNQLQKLKTENIKLKKEIKELKEKIESDPLRPRLFELKVKYNELLRNYRKVSDELLIIKIGVPKEIKNDNIRSK